MSRTTASPSDCGCVQAASPKNARTANSCLISSPFASFLARRPDNHQPPPPPPPPPPPLEPPPPAPDELELCGRAPERPERMLETSAPVTAASEREPDLEVQVGW